MADFLNKLRCFFIIKIPPECLDDFFIVNNFFFETLIDFAESVFVSFKDMKCLSAQLGPRGLR